MRVDFGYRGIRDCKRERERLNMSEEKDDFEVEVFILRLYIYLQDKFFLIKKMSRK